MTVYYVYLPCINYYSYLWYASTLRCTWTSTLIFVFISFYTTHTFQTTHNYCVTQQHGSGKNLYLQIKYDILITYKILVRSMIQNLGFKINYARSYNNDR